ncbi:glycosyltransferase family 4 protein [Oscillatoria sp. CS-180]|uniref:glycosyltransferase family 4 protein n=1 Tax=Oscillatoria sp. CS-180 TaxID=3021720 RepID=UPI00232E24C8|nr:glycosyltransferase family 4 protein [Oscillatoria sp. CS-180]MDB9528197.1 glycosyltransferase family 4 protein [Oscillatoria sp. CS-180]
MKIAYLTGEYPRATDTFIQREVSNLRKHGMAVETFSIRKPSEEHLVGAEQKAERARTHYLLPLNPLFLIWCHLICALRSPRNYWQGIKLAWQTSQPGFKGGLFQLFYFLEAVVLAHKLRQQDISHLHNHIANSSCTVAMLAAKIGGGTFSFTMHGPHIFFEPHRWRLDEKIRQASFVSCISHFCRSQGMLFVSPDHWSKLRIIHCGVEPDLFQPKQHEGQGNHLLYVGRLAAMKGLPVLFEAMDKLKDQLPDLKLTVVGDGGERSDIEAIAQELDLSDRIDFVGYKSQTEVREYLQTADIFVLPSFAEGVPVVLMEAMAAGVPVLTTRIAGVPELVTHNESGWLVPPGDTVALADGLKMLVNDAALRNQFGKAGHDKVVAEFNVVQESKKLSEIF